jgi:hypothetical protein
MRRLSDTFMADLANSDGILNPILERVKNDHTLMLAIRDNYINIYYRGGNILNAKQHIDKKSKKVYYKTHFDVNYNKSGQYIPESPTEIRNQDDSKKWVDSFSNRKNVMDEYLSKKGKTEREFQQLVVRENNNSNISGESEYFISDIEVTAPHARFDLMAIRWLAKERKSGNKCKAALIEMKYSDDALEGDAGLVKHIEDMHNLISKKERYAKVLYQMKSQFSQLDELGLFKFNKGTSNVKVDLDVDSVPEVIFILANHNPRSDMLKKILKNSDFDKYEQEQPKVFDLRFYVASFAGYGLHKICMYNLGEFRELCAKIEKRN